MRIPIDEKTGIFLFLMFSYTLWAQTPAPGGISSNLQVWVKADAGTATTTDNSKVPVWENQKTGGVNGIANQGMPGYYADPGIGAIPAYRTATSIPNFNFNPAIEIVSTNGYRSGYKFPSGFPDNTTNALTSYTHLSRTVSASYRTVFVMNGTTRSSNTSLIAGIWQSPFFGTQGNRPEFYNEKESGDVFFGTNTITTVGTEVPSIQSYYNRLPGTNMNYLFGNNGLEYGQPSNGVSSTFNYPGMVLLMDNDAGSGSTSLAGDRIGEFILYSGTQTDSERQRVNSYLAVKYGVTLVQPQDYIASDETVITWNSSLNTAFNNNIFGLAKDDDSALKQLVTNSINTENNSMLIISTDNDFVSANSKPDRSDFLQDRTFLLIGDNNDQSLTLVNSGTAPGQRIQRIWLAQRKNDTGSTWLQADLSAYTSILATDNISMIIADDSALSQNVQVIPAAGFTGGKAVFNYSFPDNKYFTFGTNIQTYCTKDPAAGTPNEMTKFGITAQSRQMNWPANIPNGFIALESKNKGFVITRTTAANIAVPVEGMLIYDTVDKCFKLYNGTGWNCITRSCND
ncbi:hypothetical protein [Chryseobacterium vrystaatense]|uniref:DUF8202 domain-containing protein n=1 Tax=Chryseobacterium vrystaatense TaxID=307480 RepID=A0ABR4UGY2_9FLAO|nr:hypothetical protein [Chryseobacterium vrystaatense]KFF23804.1 hypothetical protein IW16_23195 [Chryseobacterium vrystaatense]